MRNIRLRPAIAIVLLLCFLVPVLFGGWLTIRERKKMLQQDLESDQHRIIDILVLGVQESLWALYPDSGLPLVKAIMTDDRIVHVVIESEDGIFIERSNPIHDNQEIQSRSKSVYFHGSEIGRVTVEMDTSHLREMLAGETTKYLLLILVPFLISMLVLYYLLQIKILKPLEVLNLQSESLAGKMLDRRFRWKQHDEMGLLGQSLEKTRKSLRDAFQELEQLHEQAVKNSQEQAAINRQLQHEIAERKNVEEELRLHKDGLEKKVRERTRELVEANDNLLQEFEERKRAEEERRRIALKLHRSEKMEALGVLASGVAHDLNNILAGIVSYPDLLLLKVNRDSDLYQPIMEIKSAGKRAAAVVADLLTIARSTATAYGEYDLNRLVREYFQSPEFDQLENAYLDAHLEVHLDAEQPGVKCSPVHVKKCLMNLITNAFEASDRNGLIAVLTTNEEVVEDQESLPKNRYVVLSVRDSGPGIAREDMEHIFEPFYSTKQMGMSGSGLGLTIVWNTMEEHGGRVVVESDESGTCFKLYFPVVSLSADAPETAERLDYPQGNNELILVVDDEDLIQSIARRMLEDLGYRVQTVSSGEEAIAFLQETEVDAVILDMVMDPGINGRETYKQIIDFRPGQKAMIVSGFAMNDDIRAALDLGVSTFLKKPYTLDELARALRRTLDG